jgi:uncharacterized protein YggE
MENSVKITLIIVVGLLVLGLFGVYMFNKLIPPGLSGNTISVNGNSVVKVNPDLVTVYFNVETNGLTTKEANDANKIIVDKLITSMLKLGFAREDIQTENLYISEDSRWENGKYKNYGFKASHQIKIEMNSSQASLIGDVVDAGVNAGARLQWINFELSTAKQNEYKAQALKEAGIDAKTKAQAIAEGLDKRLGSLVSISTSDWGYQPWNVYMAKSGGMIEDAAEAKLATTNIQPGTQEVTGYVSVVYKIR